jgi:hypothetical protein
MKRNWVSKFAGLVLVLTLVTSSLVSGTYAKYVTTVTATDSVSVAAWVVELEDNGTTNTTYTTTFDLIGTLTDTGVNGNLLAPGTVGSFSVDYDTTGTEVAHNILIELDVADLLTDLTYLKFYSDSGRTTLLTPTAGVIEVADVDRAASAGTTGTATVYWGWAFSADGTQDTADTLDGIAADDFDVTVTLTATQLDVAA